MWKRMMALTQTASAKSSKICSQTVMMRLDPCSKSETNLILTIRSDSTVSAGYCGERLAGPRTESSLLPLNPRSVSC